MAAQKGLDVLMKIDISGTKTTIGGLRSTSITLNDESVDITNKDSLGSRTLLAGAGVNSLICKWFRSLYRFSSRSCSKNCFPSTAKHIRWFFRTNCSI